MSKILVIEDEKFLQEEISEILRIEGFDVIHAENGMLGEEMAIKYLPDLILCDIMMPGQSGTDVLSHLKLLDSTNRIPFIFMTALAERKHLRTGMELGADDYLTKPFTVQELLLAVRARLKKQEVNIRFLESALDKVRTEMSNRIQQFDFPGNQLSFGLPGNSPGESNVNGHQSEADQSILEAIKSIDSNNTLLNLERLIKLELQQSGLSKETESALIKMQNEIRKRSNLVNNWTIFQMKFNQFHPGFVEALVKINPKLTSQDLTLASAVTINLNTQQLAGLFNISADSVRKSRYRLKQKLNLKDDKHLHHFLCSLLS
jgi:DNA-binding response OmpR family regulator